MELSSHFRFFSGLQVPGAHFLLAAEIQTGRPTKLTNHRGNTGISPGTQSQQAVRQHGPPIHQ